MRSAPALAALALVGFGEYDPGTVPTEPAQRVRPSGRVLHVTPRTRGGIQAAVARARAGDTVRIAPGAYRGGVQVRGASRRGLRLVGDGARLRGGGTVGLRVCDTAQVTVRGLSFAGYAGAAVAVRAVDRPVLDRLSATGGGIGFDLRRAPGATISRVLASGNAGAGIALAADPPAPRPVRSFVREVTLQGNAVGLQLDATRATTVTRARITANRTGIRTRGADGLVVSSSVLTGNMTDRDPQEP